jgi:hypothetical protein
LSLPETVGPKSSDVHMLDRHVRILYEFVFRCEEHLYKRLRPSVGRLVGPSVPMMQLRGKLVTSRLLREEEEEENWLRRDSFAPRD